MATEKHIVELLMEYALAKGAKGLNSIPGLWESEVDNHWTIRCNGHDTEVKNVPPFSWTIEFNGWPAGIISIMGEGMICAGELGNEENLKNALIENM